MAYFLEISISSRQFGPIENPSLNAFGVKIGQLFNAQSVYEIP